MYCGFKKILHLKKCEKIEEQLFMNIVAFIDNLSIKIKNVIYYY